MCVHVCSQVDINIILMNKLNYFTNHLGLSYLLMIQCIRIKALLFLHTRPVDFIDSDAEILQ